MPALDDNQTLSLKSQRAGQIGLLELIVVNRQALDARRDVEEQVDGLKERVFRSKATLQLLKEIVIQGASTGAIRNRRRPSTSFSSTSARSTPTSTPTARSPRSRKSPPASTSCHGTWILP